MKILICNAGLDGIGGSETFCYTLIKELVKRGYGIECYTHTAGQIAEKIEKDFGVKTYTDIETLKMPDVIHAHHTVGKIAIKYFKTPAVCVSHGIIQEEIPLSNVKLFVVSEELQKLYGGEILRNGIDLERFRPEEREIKYRVLNTRNYSGRLFEVEDEINVSQVVLAKGRGALEAMACNRPTILYSHFGMGGLITEDNIDLFKQANFSARNIVSSVPLQEEIERALKVKGYNMRSIIEREFSSIGMVDKLEKAYREIA